MRPAVCSSYSSRSRRRRVLLAAHQVEDGCATAPRAGHRSGPPRRRTGSPGRAGRFPRPSAPRAACAPFSGPSSLSGLHRQPAVALDQDVEGGLAVPLGQFAEDLARGRPDAASAAGSAGWRRPDADQPLRPRPGRRRFCAVPWGSVRAPCDVTTTSRDTQIGSKYHVTDGVAADCRPSTILRVGAAAYASPMLRQTEVVERALVLAPVLAHLDVQVEVHAALEERLDLLARASVPMALIISPPRPMRSASATAPRPGCCSRSPAAVLVLLGLLVAIHDHRRRERQLLARVASTCSRTISAASDRADWSVRKSSG